ncbi:hypothetical protein OFC23_32330, partial [Escherichia coli]|nr:hypothetical protein [Escherichia coli]
GKWNWDTRRATFCLTPNRPDEIEILQAAENDTAPETEAETEINSDTVKTVHSGRFVPIYRKLGTFSGKRVREIIYDLLQ